jgi:hypothetical protein
MLACCMTMDDDDQQQANAAAAKDDDENGDEEVSPEEARLDEELHILRKMKQAFASSLHMLEAARDDLVEMGNRMDQLRRASEVCRKAILSKDDNTEQDSQGKDRPPL